MTQNSVVAQESPLIYGLNVEQLEWRSSDNDSSMIAWDGKFLIGSDEQKFVLRNTGEFETDESIFETLETYGLVQIPISRLYDVTVGIRLDTSDELDRAYGAIGIQGTGPFSVETRYEFFLSKYSSARAEFKNEISIASLTLTPSFEINLPFIDDEEMNVGEWGASLELGARMSFDLGYGWSPHIGVHYEAVVGETKDLVKAKGENTEALRFVVGLAFMF